MTVSSAQILTASIVNLGAAPAQSQVVITIGASTAFSSGEMGPYQILASAGTPFVDCVANDKLQVAGSSSNDGSYTVLSITSGGQNVTVVEAIVTEGPITTAVVTKLP
jgi:hypothetical protein